MELAAIHLARAMAFVEPIDLNPTGKVSYPALAEALIGRYDFRSFPKNAEDFDETKGIKFVEGRFGGIVVEQLVIYAYGIMVDTRVSTGESRRLLEDAIQWASKELGLANKPIKRWQYVSQIVFSSEFQLTAIHPAFQFLADSTAEAVSQIAGEHINYELTAIFVDHDPLSRRHAAGRFSIQRRDNTPFSENRYFSDAPLPTDLHIKVLEQFEAKIAKQIHSSAKATT